MLLALIDNDLGAGLYELLKTWGMSTNQASIIRSAIIILGILIFAIVANYITKRIILSIVRRIIRRSKNDYDDVFLERNVFTILSHIVPALIIYYLIPLSFNDKFSYPFDYTIFIEAVQGLCYIYMIVVVLMVLNSLLDSIHDIYQVVAQRLNIKLSIKVYIQVIKILFILIGIIMIFSVLLGKSLTEVFVGLGALAAILLLIFKDTILGFVASIQLSAYKMLKVGDWITMDSRGADGTVIDISLSTVKVQNFNKTISTIPTYSLVSESFTNWAGMQTSGGRRIMRSIYIDKKSIKFCTPEMLERFKKITILKSYIEEKETEIAEHNSKLDFDNSVETNGRRLTNIGTFRKYIELYLRNNLRKYKKISPQSFVINNVTQQKFVIEDENELVNLCGVGVKKFFEEVQGKTVLKNQDRFLIEYDRYFEIENNVIYFINTERKKVLKNGNEVEEIIKHKIIDKDGRFLEEMTLLVRQLQATEIGLPIQIYVFASTTAWVDYETIQADLFDHLFAIIDVFELKVFQSPSGEDFTKLFKRLK